MVSTRMLFEHFFIDEVLDVLHLLIRNRSEMREIKSQSCWIDQRSRLLYVRSQHLAQRRMQQMRAGMIAPRGRAVIRIDNRIDLVANLQRLAQNRPVRKDPLHRLRASAHIGDDRVVIVGVEPARIAHLPTRIGIEAGVIENDFHRIAGSRRRNAQHHP